MDKENYLNGKFVNSRFKNEKGKKFNRLFVLDFAYIKNRAAHWKCRCDCGNITIVSGADLRRGLKGNGGTKSCGCLAREITIRTHTGKKYSKKKYAEANKRVVFRNYISSAERRNIDFDLDFDTFISLASQNCFYCDSIPSQSYKKGNYYGIFIHNGVDRVDNSKGYTKDNCVPCCKICNMAKSTMSINEFYTWIGKIVKNGMPLSAWEI